MPKTPAKGALTRLRGLATGERGNTAFITIASVLVIGVLGGTVATSLSVAMNASADMKANNAISSAVSSAAQRDAAKGFQATSALPAAATVQIPLGATTIPALRTVVVDSEKQKADVTYTAGRYDQGEYTPLGRCDDAPTTCLSATSIAAPSLALTVPYVNGVTVADPTANLPSDGVTRWQGVAAGANHMLGLDQSGRLWAWGAGENNQLGTDKPENHPLPAVIAEDRQWSKVAASRDTSFAIDAAGSLWAWGANTDGLRGDTDDESVPAPRQILTERTFTDVVASAKIGCALEQTGQAFCWGPGLLPTQVGAGKTYVQIAPGNSSVLLRDKAGAVSVWSLSGEPTPVPMDEAATYIAAGPESFYVVDVFGRLSAWGENAHGQLGDKTTTARIVPVKVASGLRFKIVGAGPSSAYGITRDGNLYAWGGNGNGELGLGNKAARTEPTLVSSEAAFIAVIAGQGTTAGALDSGHRLWLWGSNAAPDVFGDGDAAKERLQARQMDMSPPPIDKVAAGRAHSAVLDISGRVYAWGANNFGQLGTGDTGAEDKSAEAVAEYDNASIVQVSANGTGTITALTTTGILVSSGNNDRGQLGNGTTGNTATPVRTGDARYSKVDLGYEFGIAIGRDDNRAYTWGANTYGELADGTANDRRTLAPVQGIPEETRIVDIAAGSRFGVALDDEGQVWTWGRNFNGQLGDGTKTDRRTAEAVPIPAKITAIAAGYEFVLAVDVEGGLWTWGKNHAGQLGNGTAGADVVVPAQVATPSPVVQVAAGRSHGMAITRTGQLISWGGADDVNMNGHGDKTTLTPTVIAAVAERQFISVNGGGENSVAVDGAGEIYMWGPSAAELALSLDQYDESAPPPTEETGTPENGGTGEETTPEEEAEAPETGGDTCIVAPVDPTPAPTEEPAPETTEPALPVEDEEADEGAEELPVDEELPVETPDCTAEEPDTGGTEEPTPEEEAEESEGVHLDNMIVTADVHNSNLVIVDGSGNVVVTGAGTSGQLGDGSTVEWSTAITEVTAWRTAADAVDDLSGKPVRFRDIAAGGDMTAAVDTNGFLWTWGDNSDGQLGAGPSLERSDKPALAWTASRFLSVSTGGESAAAIDNVGQAWVWGAGGVTAPVNDGTVWIPARIPAEQNFSKVAISRDHALAIDDSDGEVFGWGANAHGEIVAGAPTMIATPTTTVVDGVTDIAAGDGFSVGLDEDGAAFTWGSRAGLIGGDATFSQVAASGEAAAAVRDDGHLIRWSAADGTTTDTAGAMFTRADIGTAHTLAVDVDGHVWSWGDDADGQLGRNGAADAPGVVRQLGTERLEMLETPVTETSVWKVAKVTGEVSGIVQLDVAAPVPVDSVGIWCESTKNRIAVTPATPSSGTYMYGNVDTAMTAECADPYFAVFVEGQAITTSEVQAVLLPVQRTGIEVAG